MSVWNALWVPKGTPKEIIVKLNAAAMDALADQSVRNRMHDLGLEIPSRDEQALEALGAFHKAEIDKWQPIIRASNIKLE
jgi:tripartite-type tricarboxylate transporter receptor subunit TctC